MAYRTKSAFLACVVAILGGCGDDGAGPDATAGDTDSTDTGDAADTGTSEGSADESSSDTASEPEHLDLFACEGLPAACEQVVQHIDPEPESALECAAELLVSGQPGVLSMLDTPGPDVDETETLIVLLGDGTALVQSRGRSCSECSADTLPWEPSGEHRLCTLSIDPDLEVACDPACETDCNCTWDPFIALGDCEAVADWTCESALAAVAPA